MTERPLCPLVIWDLMVYSGSLKLGHMGWGGGSVGKVLAVQAWDLRSDPQFPWKSQAEREVDHGGTMASGLATVVGSLSQTLTITIM